MLLTGDPPDHRIHGAPITMTTDWRRRLATVSDEAGESFAEAADLCLTLGICAFELRQLPGGRVPYVDADALDEVEELTKRHHLKLIGISPGFCKRAVDAPEVETEFAEGFPAAFDLMNRLGIGDITLFTYLRAGQPSDTPIPQQVIDNLGRATRLCRDAGVRVRLENVAACWGNTGASVGAIADALDVGIAWDPANSEASGQPAYPDGYGCVRSRVSHVHCKNWTARGGCVDIDAGDADLAGQVRALVADGYSGYFTVEPHRWGERAQATRRNTAQLLQLLEETDR